MSDISPDELRQQLDGTMLASEKAMLAAVALLACEDVEKRPELERTAEEATQKMYDEQRRLIPGYEP